MMRMLRLVVVWGCAAVAGAQQSFTSEDNGTWRDGWNTWGVHNQFPEADDDAVIDGHLVNLAFPEQVNDLSVEDGATLTLNGHKMTVHGTGALSGGSSIVSGTMQAYLFNLYSGTLDGIDLTVGELTWSGGTIDGGRVDATDIDFLASGGLTMKNASLSASGALVKSGSGTLTFDQNPLVVSNSFSFGGTGDLWLKTSPMTLFGTFTHSDSGVVQLNNCNVTNAGTWRLAVDHDSHFGSSGRFINQGGTLRKSGGSGASDVEVGVDFYGGTVQVDSGYIRFNSGEHSSFSNVTFSMNSGSFIDFVGDADLAGTLGGSGGDQLGFVNGRFYPADNTVIGLSDAPTYWYNGRFDGGSVTFTSPLHVRGSDTHWGLNGSLTAAEGIVHTGTGRLSIQSASLTIPVGTSYEVHGDGERVGASATGRLNLNGTLVKTNGSGTATVNIPLYGDGSRVRVDEGTLDLPDGNGLLNNLNVQLASGAQLYCGATISNAVITADTDGTVVQDYDDNRICGLWSLTNSTLYRTGYYSSYYTDVTPSITFEGTNSQVTLYKGGFSNGTITNRIPMRVPADAPARGFSYCTVRNESTMTLESANTSLGNSIWVNETNGVLDVAFDGDNTIFTSGSVYNNGTVRKSAGTGLAYYAGNLFRDSDGVLQVDSGTLRLNDSRNHFKGTHVQLASNTTLQISGEVTSNLTAEAEGPATLWLAHSHDQVVQNDIHLTGPVTVQLSSFFRCELIMNGALIGDEASFRWTDGKIDNCYMTNNLPMELSGSGTRYLEDGRLYVEGGAEHSGGKLSITRASLYNGSNSLYRLAADGELFYSSLYGNLRNQGTLLKTAGSGITDVKAIFQNLGGTVGADCGTLRFFDPVDLTGGGLQIALGGSNDFGRVTTDDAVTLGGSLTVTLRDGFAPIEGDQFVVLSGSSLSGAFDTLDLPSLSGGLGWDVDASATSLTLTVIAGADTDGDGMSDYDEQIVGTDPDNPDSLFLVALDGTALSWIANSGRVYSVEWTASLTNEFQPLENMTNLTTSPCVISNDLPQGYFRLKVEWPE